MLENFRKLMDVLKEGDIPRTKADKTTTKLLGLIDGDFIDAIAVFLLCDLTRTR